MLSHADLIARHRSTAMLPPASTVSITREELFAVLDELLALRSLVGRVGADLVELAKEARRQERA